MSRINSCSTLILLTLCFSTTLACFDPIEERDERFVAGWPDAMTREECTRNLSVLGIEHSFDLALEDVPTPVRLHSAGPGVDLVYDSPVGNEIPGSLRTSCAIAIALGQTVRNMRTQGYSIDRLYHVGSYNPRNIGGSDSTSAHSFATALDVRGIRSNGARVELPSAYGSSLLGLLERELRANFDEVIGPEFDSDHLDHFHVEQSYGALPADSGGFEFVQRVGEDQIYVLEDGWLHKIHSLENYLAMGAASIRALEASHFDRLPHARSVDGSDEPLLKTDTSPDIFVLKLGARWLLEDEEAFYACTDLDEFSSVFAHATQALLTQWPIAGTLRKSDCEDDILEETPASMDADNDGIPDDLDRIHQASATRLCLRRDVFSLVEPGPFSVVGDGIGGWGFNSEHLATVTNDWLCYDFSASGQYRVTWRTELSWAMYPTYCATLKDPFCSRDPSGSYGIGFESRDGLLYPVVGDE